jgi:hypothetical protein
VSGFRDTAPVETFRSVQVTCDPESPGVSLEILVAHPDVIEANGDRRAQFEFNPDQDAARVFDALTQLPLETRRAFSRIMSEHGDGFVGAPRPKAKVHPSSPRVSRRSQR